MYPIRIYLYPKDLTVPERHPVEIFDRKFTEDWFDDDFARYCVHNIDCCEFSHDGWFHHRVRGYVRAKQLSGGLKTMIMARRNPDLKFPLSHLGNNCMSALMECSKLTSTNWYYLGRFPKFLPEQEIYITDTDELIKGSDIREWELFKIPDWANKFIIGEKAKKEWK